MRDFMLSLLLAGSLVTQASIDVDAEETVESHGSSRGANIGFMPNPPKELTKKFAMCDEFLKVNWIAKDKGIGYTTYEVAVKGKDGGFSQKKRISALVDLNTMRFDYDVSQYEQENRLTALFEAIKKGKVDTDIAMWIVYRGETIELHFGENALGNEFHPLMGDHWKTVCIVYPDGKTAWIMEGKTVSHAYSGAQKELLLQRLQETDGAISRHWLESLWVLNVNFDGKDDYISQQSVIYSWADKLYKTTRERDASARYTVFTFPPTNRQCRLYGSWHMSPLLTDGQTYYLSDKCNLTQLTSQTKE